MADKNTSITPTRGEDRGIRRRSAWIGGPYRMLERFADEMDQMFDDFGLGRRMFNSPSWSVGRSSAPAWKPDVDVLQRNNELIVRADIPGLSKDDITIDVTDDAITIQGERRDSREEERDGVYRTERSYGKFCRVIPLPEGAITDQAKATFRDGVLEVTMPAPPEQVTRGRRLEIREGASAEAGKTKN